MLSTDQRHKTNTQNDFFYPERHLFIDNTTVAPDHVAQQIVTWLDTFNSAT